MGAIDRLRAIGRRFFEATPGAIPVGVGGLPWWLRNRGADPLNYAPVSRCVSLISKDGARLITKTLLTVDEEGYRVTGRAKDARVRLLRKSVDGGRSSAFRFWKAVFADLLCEGNAFLVPRYSGDMLVGLRRLSADSVRWEPEDRSFHGHFADDRSSGDIVRIPEAGIVHCAFGSVADYGTAIAPSPLQQIAEVVAAGIAFDGRVRKHAERGPKDIVMTFEDALDDDQTKDVAESILGYIRKSQPLLINAKGQVHSIKDHILDPTTEAFQSRLVRAVAMQYGVPAAMLGEGTAAAKVESLLREYWKGLAQVVDDVLEPLSHRLLPATNSFAIVPNYLLRGDTAAATAAARALFPNTGSPRLAFLREGRDQFQLAPITREQETELLEASKPPDPPEPPDPPGPPGDPMPPPGEPEPAPEPEPEPSEQS